MFYDGDFSTLSSEQRQIVLTRPFWRMRWFASLLGWRGLQLSWLRLSDENLAKSKMSVEDAKLYWPGMILIHYQTTDVEFKIQINEQSPHNSCRYKATVGPHRYGLAFVGWHPFELFKSDADLVAEAERLRPVLDRQQYRNPIRRARFKRAHPELLASR